MDFVLKKELEKNDLIYVNITTPKNVNEVKKMGTSSKIVIVKNSNEDINRATLENRNVDILLGSELIFAKDFVHFRASGLNQVLCNLAKKNDIAIGFSFSDLINSQKKEVLLGRMMQNVLLCRKYKLKIVIGSFALKENEIKNKSELMSFGKVICMNGAEIKQALNFKKKENPIIIK